AGAGPVHRPRAQARDPGRARRPRAAPRAGQRVRARLLRSQSRDEPRVPTSTRRSRSRSKAGRLCSRPRAYATEPRMLPDRGPPGLLLAALLALGAAAALALLEFLRVPHVPIGPLGHLAVLLHAPRGLADLRHDLPLHDLRELQERRRHERVELEREALLELANRHLLPDRKAEVVGLDPLGPALVIGARRGLVDQR